MLETGLGEDFSVALINAGLLASATVLPILLIGYVQHFLAVQRMRPEFSLRKPETDELDRAVSLYEKACNRREEIDEQRERHGVLWRALFGQRAELHEQHADELQDVEAHAQHLRITIVRLRRRPLQRLRSWVHVVSLRFALGGALAVHIAALALLIVGFDSLWADELASNAGNPLVWYPFDEHLFYANAAGAAFAAVLAPVFYLLRRRQLHHAYALEFCTFQEFALSDPADAIDQSQRQPDDLGPQTQPNVAAANDSCFAVLGLPHSATVEEVKEAYKALIKQTHPDRVHGLSPAFRELAETETRKLNLAYQQALFSLSPLESMHSAAPN
jgi:DnaJ domain